MRSPSEGVAEGGGWGEEFRHARAFRRAKRGGYVRFRFLDLCIKFGKIISKVCDGFNSGANEKDHLSGLFHIFAQKLLNLFFVCFCDCEVIDDF